MRELEWLAWSRTVVEAVLDKNFTMAEEHIRRAEGIALRHPVALGPMRVSSDAAVLGMWIFVARCRAHHASSALARTRK